MILTVDKNSKISVFEQIFKQITVMINNGTLKTGDRLLSTRELAELIGVSRSTVSRVYEELWAQGYIESAPGSYTTVKKRKVTISNGEDYNKYNNIETNFFRDTLGLPYDPMMYYLENGKIIEKGKINFLQLSPDTRLLNWTKVKACMRDALNETEIDPFDFAPARGFHPLRQEITRHMKLHNILMDDKNILVTNSSLQSLQLIFQTFSKPGDYIVVENPTYSIILLFIKIFQLQAIEIPVTNDGMNLKMLEKVLKEKSVRFIYTMPTYHNPTGVSMPLDKKKELLNICRNRDCIIIEDGFEEEIKYKGKIDRSLKSMDISGQVIYLGAFTKILAPGLRIGWLIASQECIKRLTVLKSIFEISSSSINQIFLYNFIKNGAFELYLRKARNVFKKRMKIAINSIKKYVPVEKVEWTEPDGGYMIWIKLLTRLMDNIENHFSDFGVMVHNGKYFFLNEPCFNYIRICISQTNESEIEEGIKRIGEAIKALE